MLTSYGETSGFTDVGTKELALVNGGKGGGGGGGGSGGSSNTTVSVVSSPSGNNGIGVQVTNGNTSVAVGVIGTLNPVAVTGGFITISVRY